jgi:hypothetical protein
MMGRFVLGTRVRAGVSKVDVSGLGAGVNWLRHKNQNLIILKIE